MIFMKKKMNENFLKVEVCKTCFFYSFCKNVVLPYCDKEDYVKK